MGYWVELCFICGISPLPPSEIYSDPYHCATDLAGRIIEHDPSLLKDLCIDQQELEGVIEAALDSELPTDHPGLDSPELSWESFQTGIAIGHFDDDGDTPQQVVQKDSVKLTLFPDGQGVETRVVRDAAYGDFCSIVHRTVNEDGSGVTETEEGELSRTTSRYYCYPGHKDEGGLGNFWMSEGCYHYAQAWVDFSSLPKASWYARNLSLSGELYEILNSRERGRENGIGTHPEFSYDGIERTLEPTQYQFYQGMKQPKEMIAAIRRRASPEDVYSAIIKDCQCWMFYSPDFWPTPTNNELDQYTHFASTPSTGWGNLSTLPIEVLTQCLPRVDGLHSYLSLAQASKALWNLLTDLAYFNRMLREMAARPSHCLFWLRPVDTLNDEGKRANVVLATWLPTPEPLNSSICPLDHPAFPYARFLHACYASDSMMNRKRLWNQVKQLEVIWIDYGVNGWRVDRFGVTLEKNDE